MLPCFSVAGYSQDLTPYRLSLEQAIEMGLRNHQQLKISQAQNLKFLACYKDHE